MRRENPLQTGICSPFQHTGGAIVADIVIAICQIAGPAAVIAIGITLLGIAVGKIRA